jgi:hypothetical protein
MDLNTYVDNFYSTTICHWQPDYQYYSLNDTHSTDGHGVSRLIIH